MVFITSVFIGLCMGSGAVFSIQYGAKDYEGMKQSLVSSLVLTGGVTLVLNIIALAGIRPIIRLLQTPANFDKKQKKQELRCIRYRKSTGKKQDFMPDGILFPVSIKRENPEFTPYKVMNLRHYISHYIGYHVMFTLYMHEQSYNQCSYQGVQCTYYGKT
jgi:Na+-driven multidrug efflux pump